jgi:hypothetical protein
MKNNTVIFQAIWENDKEMLGVVPEEQYSEKVWSKIKHMIRMLFTSFTPKDRYDLGGLDDEELEDRIINELDDNIKTFYPN